MKNFTLQEYDVRERGQGDMVSNLSSIYLRCLPMKGENVWFFTGSLPTPSVILPYKGSGIVRDGLQTLLDGVHPGR